MGTIDLPLVKAATTIPEALQRMILIRRWGVIVENAGVLILLYVRQLLEALHLGVATVGEIRGGTPVLDYDPRHAEYAGLDPIDPLRTWTAYEILLRSSARQYMRTLT